MTMIKSLAYMGANVTDFDAWRQFANGLLGVQTATLSSQLQTLRLDDYARRVILQKAGHDSGAYYGFEVADSAALAAAADQLADRNIAVKAAGADELEIRRAGGMISFPDPDGNRIELCCGPELARQAFQPARPVGGFITGAYGLGHVVFLTANYDAMRAFYLDVLGFSLSDYCSQPFRATFMHVNQRHHTIALIERENPGLHHLMLELKDLDDVGRAYDIALKEPGRVSVTLGRHGNDHMLSFYANSPSRFLVELGWGGRVISKTGWQAKEFFGPSLWGHERSWLQGPARAEAQKLLDLAAEHGYRAPVQVRPELGYDLSEMD